MKKEYLEQIKEAAFNDELEKLGLDKKTLVSAGEKAYQNTKKLLDSVGKETWWSRGSSAGLKDSSPVLREKVKFLLSNRRPTKDLIKNIKETGRTGLFY